MNPLQAWKAKLGRAKFFRFQSFEITVCWEWSSGKLIAGEDWRKIILCLTSSLTGLCSLAWLRSWVKKIRIFWNGGMPTTEVTKRAKFRFSRSSYTKIVLIYLKWFSCKIIGLGDKLLTLTFFDNVNFWTNYFVKMVPIFVTSALLHFQKIQNFL